MYSKAYYQAHKTDKYLSNKKYRTSNRGRYLLHGRDGHLRRRYGISLEIYEELFNSQGGVCILCGQPENRPVKGGVAHLSVDHSHKTGKVRGLLCYKFNSAIGQIDAFGGLLWLAKAANYIK